MKSISSILPPTFAVEEKLSELYEFALSSQIENSLQDVCSNTTFYFTSMYQEIVDTNFVQTNVVERTAYNIIFHVISFLIDLQPLITSDIECSLEDVIASHITQFFNFLVQLMTVSGLRSCPDKGNAYIYKML